MSTISNRLMEVVLGSNNEAKERAVNAAFSIAYPDTTINLRAVAANSGVAAHPLTGTESLRGACNRVEDARKLIPDSDYYVGIEGGLLAIDTRVYLLGYVAVANRNGNIATGLSGGPELRGELLEAVRNGKDLNYVLHEHLGMQDVGVGNGFCGLATGDSVSRTQTDVQAVLFALAQFRQPEYFS